MSTAVFALNVHQTYRCRHAGVCCQTGWAIAIDPLRADAIRAALGTGRLHRPASAGEGASPLVTSPAPPEGSAAILATDRDGACAFFERSTSLCAIHRDLGHDALPEACRQFPRVGLVDRRGTFMTLSHYCPTAARLLARHEQKLSVVRMTETPAPRGLDARDALPPLLCPDLLMDWTDYDRWERRAIDTLADEASDLQSSLVRIVRGVEDLRIWRPGPVPLSNRLDAIGRDAPVPVASPDEAVVEAIVSAYESVAGAVPADLGCQAVPAVRADEMRAHVWPALRAHDHTVRRYLAARVFGSWLAYHGRGLRTVVAGMLAAWAVLQVEVARTMRAAPGPLDEDRLVAALGAADHLLVHLADVGPLARRLAPVEAAGGDTSLWLLASSGRP